MEQNSQKNYRNDIHAVIMAGGEGTRLRPITCTMPKPLVPLLNRPVIDYCLELLSAHGIKNVSQTLYYMADMIENHVGDGSAYGLNVTHSRTDKPLGTAGSVKRAVDQVNNSGTVLVISGDTLTDCDLSGVIAFHKAKGAAVTIVLKRVEEPMEYGVVIMDDENKITRFIEKPAKNEVFSDLANTGIYVIEPEVFEQIPNGEQFDFSNDLFPALMNAKKGIYGYETDAYWCDIGDIDQYMRAQRDMLDAKVRFLIPKGVSVHDGCYIESGAQISETAFLEAPCYISKDAQIGSFARIGKYSVIGTLARVYPYADIKRSVVMPQAVIRDNARLRGAVICPEAQIDSFAEVFESSVIGERAIIGEGASVTNGACVWTDKVTEHGSTISKNLIWGNAKRITCMDDGITGYADTDISPETVLRLSAAFARAIGDGYSNIGVSSTGGMAGVMLKRAAASGVVSQGVNVYDLPRMTFQRFMFSVDNMGLVGGIYIDTVGVKAHKAHITLLDSTGSAIDSKLSRKVMRYFYEGEQKPVTNRAVGVIEEIGVARVMYDVALQKTIDLKTLKKRPLNVLLDAPESIYEPLNNVLSKANWRVISADTRDGAIMQDLLNKHDCAIGFYMRQENEPLPEIMQKDGTALSDMALMCVLMEGIGGDAYVAPISFPDEYTKHLRDRGVALQVAPDEWHAWRRAAITAGLYRTELFDPVGAMLKLCELEAAGELSGITHALPEVYIRERGISMARDGAGRVLSTFARENAETVDGVKVHADNGWVLIKSDSNLGRYRVICGSFKAEYADELCGIYIDKIRAITEHADN